MLHIHCLGIKVQIFSEMPIVIHGDPFSVSTRLVTITLEYLGVKYDFRMVDVMKGDNLSTSYSKVPMVMYTCSTSLWIPPVLQINLKIKAMLVKF